MARVLLLDKLLLKWVMFYKFRPIVFGKKLQSFAAKTLNIEMPIVFAPSKEVSIKGQGLTAAEKMYQSHLKNVAKYQKKNCDKMKEKQTRYLAKMKEEPERYNEFLKRRRNYYKDVLKPRKEQKIEELRENRPTTLVI